MQTQACDWCTTDNKLIYPLEWLARAGWVQLMVEAVGRIGLEWLRPRPRDGGVEAGGGGHSSEAARSFSERLKRQVMEYFSEDFKGAKNFCAETFLDGLLYSVDHIKSGVLRQMGRSVQARAFVSALGSPDHVYSDHYDQIETPALVMVGGRDRIANADVTREVFYDRIRSADKQFMRFDDLAHGEFEYSPAAYGQVYPQVLEWIGARSH